MEYIKKGESICKVFSNISLTCYHCGKLLIKNGIFIENTKINNNNISNAYCVTCRDKYNITAPLSLIM